jgi:hypothetical protein
MSVIINIFGRRAVLKNLNWRSADPLVQELLDAHIQTLNVPAHYPPSDRERLTAEAAVKDFGAEIVEWKLEPEADESRMPDGRLIVY